LRDRLAFLLARLLPSVLGLVVASVLTRLLNPEQYGLYAFGQSIVFFLTMGLFEWLGLSVMRMATSTSQPDAFFRTVMTCFSALFGLCALVAGLALILGEAGSYAWLATSSLVAAFASIQFELKLRLQMAELRAGDYFRMSMARGVINTALVCATTYVWHSAYASLFAAGISILLAGLTVREPRLSFVRVGFDKTIFLALFRFGFPLSISVGLGTILVSVDRWLLQALSGPEAVGLFTAATLVGQMPIVALANGTGPSAYSMAVQALELRSREAANTQLAENFIILLGVVVPSAAGIVALSDNLAHLLVGHFYWASVVALAPWLAASAVVGTVRGFYVDIAFQLANRTAPLIWLTLLAMAINVGLDVWLIPRLAELGAAIGSFCALMTSGVVASIYSRRVFRLPVPVADSAKVLASSAAMFLIVQRVAGWSGAWALAGQIGLGASVYALLILALNVMNVRGWLMQRLPYVCRRLLPSR
jgi:O-antigen/teichoic acid export membrane protein